jgi:hypothetical protein
MVEIQSRFDYVIRVNSVRGIGFAPFPDPSEPTNAYLTGAVNNKGSGHSLRGRIVVHDTATIVYRDPSGNLHHPKVKIIDLHPGQKDYGWVRIVITGPEEVLVYKGEMKDPELMPLQL